MDEKADALARCERAAERRLPRWEELPDLELYMDQVLSLMERYLGDSLGRRGLTASMVNNYVKLGALPPPVKKKYTRSHLAHLLIICVLKASLPIDSIRRMTEESFRAEEESAFYNGFCEQYERTAREAAEAAIAQVRAEGAATAPIYLTALRAQAEQALALELYEVALGGDDGKQKKTSK